MQIVANKVQQDFVDFWLAELKMINNVPLKSARSRIRDVRISIGSRYFWLVVAKIYSCLIFAD